MESASQCETGVNTLKGEEVESVYNERNSRETVYDVHIIVRVRGCVATVQFQATT